MNIKYIYGFPGSGKSDLCIDEILKSYEKGNRNIIYIVPEQFTLQSENKLIKKFKNGVIMNVNVLSFKRLAHNLFSELGKPCDKLLEDVGKLMLIRKIAYENSKKLSYFRKSVDKDGFLENVSKLITEFFTYDISSELLETKLNDLNDNPELCEKLKDLTLIYKEYKNYLKKEYVSEDETLDLLSGKIKNSDLIKNSEIWIDEFNGFTPQEFKVIKELLKYAECVTITFCSETSDFEYKKLNKYDPFFETKNTINKLTAFAKNAGVSFLPHKYLKNNIRQKDSDCLIHLSKNYLPIKKEIFTKKTDDIIITKAKNKYDEVNLLAANILSLVRDKGFFYSDIAVILGDSEYDYLIKIIFSQYNIPYFIDVKDDITSNRITELICSFFEIFTTNWSYEPVFRFLKTYLTPLEPLDVSILENYVLERGIKGKSWLLPKWESGFSNPDYNEDDINYLKDCFIDCLKPFTDYIKPGKKYTVKEISLRLYNFLKELHLENILDYEKSPECFSVYKILTELIDKTVEILGNQNVTIAEYSKILNAGIKSCKMGRLPQSQDEIIIGDLKRTRLSDVKVLFILSVNDGVIPSVSGDDEIFSDDDKNLLSKKGIEISPPSAVMTAQDNFLLFKMFSKPKEKLYLSYITESSDKKDKKPSKIISVIKKIFPELKEKKTDENPLEKITLPLPAFSELSISLSQYGGGKPLDNIYKDLYTIYSQDGTFKPKLDKITADIFMKKYEDSLSSETVFKLYGKDIYSSVTQLEKYASCPFAFFMEYGLKAKKRKIYEVSGFDIGSIFHRILEDFSKYLNENNLKWAELMSDKIDEIVSFSIENLLTEQKNKIFSSSAKYKFMLGSIKKTSARSVKVLAEHLKAGNFSPIGFEVGFGNKSNLPPIIIELKNNSKLILTGKIDRIDILNKDGKSYVKIIDYKTGEINYDLSDVYYGLKLQLLIYLDAVIKTGKELIGNEILPGGIFYFKIHDSEISFDNEADITEEKIKKEIMRSFKMDGLTLNDISLLKMIDNLDTGSSNIFSFAITKDGLLSKQTIKKLATLEEFKELRKYVILLAEKFGNEIIEGNIKISPYTKPSSGKSSCTYCEFSSVCFIETDERDNMRRLKKTENPLDEIIEYTKNI